VEENSVVVATVVEAIFVAAGVDMKLEQNGVALCGRRIFTMRLTSLQKLGGAATTAGTINEKRAANLERILTRRLISEKWLMPSKETVPSLQRPSYYTRAASAKPYSAR
jgi:hypothetical protein